MKRIIRIVAVISLGLCLARAENRYEQALGLANQGRIEEAMKLVENPANNDERIFLAKLHDYEGDPEKAVEVMEAGLEGELPDMYLLAEILAIRARQGEDGPTVSYKRGSVCYSPSKDADGEEAWKKEHLQMALNVCDKALALVPDDNYFQYNKARLMGQLGRYDDAVKIIAGLSERMPDNVELNTELADLYLSGGSTNKAIECLEKCIEMDAGSAEAYRMLAGCYTSLNETAKADQYTRMAEFYDWIPPFAELAFTSNNVAVYEVASGAKEVEPEERIKVIDALIADTESDDAMVFLAALCYHHCDHGELENRAFSALEKREEAGIPVLLELLTSAQSVCTGRQAGEALARQKCKMAVEPLIHLLTADTRFIWTYNAAGCLAQIGDDRAVTPLLKMADVTTELSEPEDDPMHGFSGRMSARYRATVALGVFESQKERITTELLKGITNPQMAPACYAALYHLHGKELDKEAVAKSLEKDDEYRLDLEYALRAIDHPRAEELMVLVEIEEKTDGE